MSVLAEFIGGPLDGEILKLSEAFWTWRVPVQPVIEFISAAHAPDELLPMRTLVYERAERRPTPAGGMIYRYRLRRDS